MARLGFGGAVYETNAGESVLECLERMGHAPPSSCRSGQCQSCLMQVVEGELPAGCQEGLKDAWRERGLFLACMCRPEAPLVVAFPDAHTAEVPGRLVRRERLSDDVVRLFVEPLGPFPYRAGQFVNLVRPGTGVIRSYSIASLPERGLLELHVREVPGGRMSPWLCREAPVGEQLGLRGPAGDCFYLAEPDQPLLLVGTSTGLAPLLGVLRDALARGHRGPITLYHGSVRVGGLYLHDELRALDDAHPQLRVVHAVLEGPAPEGVEQRSLEELVVKQHRDRLPSARAWICGAPAFVKGLKRTLFLAGMPLAAISSDPFTPAPSR